MGPGSAREAGEGDVRAHALTPQRCIAFTRPSGDMGKKPRAGATHGDTNGKQPVRHVMLARKTPRAPPLSMTESSANEWSPQRSSWLVGGRRAPGSDARPRKGR